MMILASLVYIAFAIACALWELGEWGVAIRPLLDGVHKIAGPIENILS